jgi:hypothetical protein
VFFLNFHKLQKALFNFQGNPLYFYPYPSPSPFRGSHLLPGQDLDVSDPFRYTEIQHFISLEIIQTLKLRQLMLIQKKSKVRNLIMLLIGVCLIDCNGHRFDFRNKISKFESFGLDISVAKLVQLKQNKYLQLGIMWMNTRKSIFSVANLFKRLNFLIKKNHK